VNGWLYPAALLVGLTLSSAGLSALLLLRAQAALREAHLVARAGDAVRAASVAELEARLETLSRAVRELERAPSPAGAGPRAAMNIARRAQVLRLHKRGESVPAIAAALDLRQREVELLVKIHRMMVGGL
jgi:DNA-binding NarL/FixJ family response regulator